MEQRAKAGEGGGAWATRLQSAMWTRVLADVLKEHPEAAKALEEAAERWAREGSVGTAGTEAA